MKVFLTADGHIGNHGKNGGPMTAGLNERCRHSLAPFDHVNQLAHSVRLEEEAAHVHLGDLFDYVRVEPQVEAAVMESCERSTSVRMAMIVGNHDQKSAAPGDHAMAPLARTGVEVVDTEPVWIKFGTMLFLMIPFQEGPASVWLPEVIKEAYKLRPAKLVNAKLALCFHLGISDRDTDYFLDGADDSVSLDLVSEIVDTYKFSYVFAGNWHKHEWWTLGDEDSDEACEVVQVGTLAPNRFCDHKGRYGCAALLDTETGKIEIADIHGPRFVVTKGIQELMEFLQDPNAAQVRALKYARPLYLSATVSAANVAQAEQMIIRWREMHHGDEVREALNPNPNTQAHDPPRPVLRAYEVHADPKERQQAVTAAVASAVSAQSKEEALTGFIAETPIAPEVDRSAVVAFVNSCVKEARQ